MKVTSRARRGRGVAGVEPVTELVSAGADTGAPISGMSDSGGGSRYWCWYMVWSKAAATAEYVNGHSAGKWDATTGCQHAMLCGRAGEPSA